MIVKEDMSRGITTRLAVDLGSTIGSWTFSALDVSHLLVRGRRELGLRDAALCITGGSFSGAR